MNACPIPTCTEHAVPGQLMCMTHWRAVPPTQKHAVWTAWRTVRHRTGKRPLTLSADLRAYRVARAAAIDAVIAAEGRAASVKAIAC